MKKILKISSIVCFLFSFIFMLSACDLSHKHYVDNYGYCSSCKTDTAIVLTNRVYYYESREVECSSVDFVYFRFVSNGESSIKITIEEISGAVNYINMYSKHINNLYVQHTYGTNEYFHDQPLIEGETYYIKVKAYDNTKIKILITEEN